MDRATKQELLKKVGGRITRRLLKPTQHGVDGSSTGLKKFPGDDREATGAEIDG